MNLRVTPIIFLPANKLTSCVKQICITFVDNDVTPIFLDIGTENSSVPEIDESLATIDLTDPNLPVTMIDADDSKIIDIIEMAVDTDTNDNEFGNANNAMGTNGVLCRELIEHIRHYYSLDATST